MKPDLRPGCVARLSFRVTPEMCPHFGGPPVHPVCATWTLVQYFETAGRYVLEPHLEPHEQGVGTAARIQHRAPAAIGAEVEVEAEATLVTARRLTCRVRAHVGERLVAEGECEQAVLPRAELARRWAAAGVP